jgi:hypothetical protein
MATACLLAVTGTGIVLKLSTKPAHAACSAGGGLGHTGPGDSIHLTGGTHQRVHFGEAFEHNAAIIHAAYQPGGNGRSPLRSPVEHYVALPTGVHQGRHCAR